MIIFKKELKNSLNKKDVKPIFRSMPALTHFCLRALIES